MSVELDLLHTQTLTAVRELCEKAELQAGQIVLISGRRRK